MSESYDWVSARANCTTKKLFEELRAVVEADVKSAQSNLDPPYKVDYQIEEDAILVSAASRRGVWNRRLFELKDGRIEVKRGTADTTDLLDDMFFARPCVTPDLECRLQVVRGGVVGEPMTLSKFSRLVLEDLFFPRIAVSGG